MKRLSALLTERVRLPVSNSFMDKSRKKRQVDGRMDRPTGVSLCVSFCTADGSLTSRSFSGIPSVVFNTNPSGGLSLDGRSITPSVERRIAKLHAAFTSLLEPKVQEIVHQVRKGPLGRRSNKPAFVP